ncbi:membrane protein DedA with SNARE-associated domain [Terracoccus luteus]|uniref:Membrane protein DedA with SNARE-associated domain n=1 Tax=Terracoccus luteus TaxID=53356 RepID=A0A495XXL7_9MICO|nr:DedA family protein [Terracoccus luteus]RKT77243.1 membrane protein DedA with SNARE-associated domain [Terracoccus luteus]
MLLAVPAAPSAVVSATPTTGVAGWAIGVMETLGGLGAGLLIALENLFPPLPSEIILPLAGFTASRGEFSLVGALAWTTAGAVLGALVLYGVSRRVGEERVRAVARRMPLVDERDIDKAQAWFERHGDAAVFFGRMVPVVRSLVSVPAGVARMPAWRFVLLSAAGSLVWNGVFVSAGYLLGQNWALVEPYAEVLQYVVLAVAAALVGLFVAKRVRLHRAGVR